MRTDWIPAYVVAAATPAHREAVENFFSAAEEEDRRRAIIAVFTGVELYKSFKKNPHNPLQAAREITSIKNDLSALRDKLCSLSPDSREALHRAAMTKVDHDDLDYWHLVHEMHSDSFSTKLTDMDVLCFFALKSLPQVDSEGNKGLGRPKGKIAHHDQVLAVHMIDAFTIAHKRRPKLGTADKTEVDPIYACIGMHPSHGIIRQLLKKPADIK